MELIFKMVLLMQCIAVLIGVVILIWITPLLFGEVLKKEEK